MTQDGGRSWLGMVGHPGDGRRWLIFLATCGIIRCVIGRCGRRWHCWNGVALGTLLPRKLCRRGFVDDGSVVSLLGCNGMVFLFAAQCFHVSDGGWRQLLRAVSEILHSVLAHGTAGVVDLVVVAPIHTATPATHGNGGRRSGSCLTSGTQWCRSACWRGRGSTFRLVLLLCCSLPEF